MIKAHKYAIMASFIFQDEYVRAYASPMEFWATLSPTAKELCRIAVEQIRQARAETLEEKISAQATTPTP